MISESEIEALMSEVILGVVRNPAYNRKLTVFCAENQIDRGKLSAKKLFRMKNSTLFRLMMGIAQLVSTQEYLMLCMKIAIITYYVALLEDGSPEAIKKAHMGSPIERKRKNKEKNKEKNKAKNK